jgi:putative MFS transporter
MIATSCCGILGRLTGVYLIDKIGRKPLIIYTYSFAGAACIAFGLVTNPIHLLFFIGCFFFFADQSLAGVMAYIPELYPTRLRAVGNAYAASSSRVSSALAPMMVGALMTFNKYLYVWIAFAAVYVIGITFLAIFGPETRGKILEECTVAGPSLTTAREEVVGSRER